MLQLDFVKKALVFKRLQPNVLFLFMPICSEKRAAACTVPVEFLYPPCNLTYLHFILRQQGQGHRLQPPVHVVARVCWSNPQRTVLKQPSTCCALSSFACVSVYCRVCYVVLYISMHSYELPKYGSSSNNLHTFDCYEWNIGTLDVACKMHAVTNRSG